MKVVTLLALLLFTLQKCHYLDNGRALHFEIREQAVELIFVSPNTNNQVSFGFSVMNNTNFNQSFVWNQEKVVSFGDILSIQNLNSTIKIQKLQTEGLLDFSYDHLHFAIHLPLSALKNQTHIFYEERKSNEVTNRKTEQFSLLHHEYDENQCSELMSDRLEVYSIPVYAVMLGVHVVLCIIPFIFSRWNPVKSRGIIPFLVSISITLAFLTEIRSFFVDYSSLRYECILWSYIFIVLYDVPFAIPLIFYIRYFIIINLKRVNPHYLFYDAIENGQKVKKLKFHLKMFKYLSHPLISFFIIVMYYLINYAIYSVVLGTGKFKCTMELGELVDSVNAGVNLTIFAFSFLVLLIDMLINITPIVKCQWKKYLIDDDPFFYRLEIIQIIPILVLMIFGELTHFIPLSDGVIITRKVIHTVVFYSLLYLHVLFPAALTLLRKMRKCFRKKESVSDTVIDQIYNDPELWKFFLNFTKKEWNSENALFVEEVMNFKRRSLTKNECNRIYETFLEGSSSIYELNVPREMCEKIKVNLHNDKLTMDLFDEVFGQVKANLKDPIFRFTQTKEYLVYVNQKVLNNNILGVSDKGLNK